MNYTVEQLKGFAQAKNVAIGVVGMEISLQLLLFLLLIASLIGVKGFIQLRAGLDRRLPALIALASLLFALSDWASLSASMDPAMFFGGNCDLTERVPILASGAACITTYCFLVLRAQSFNYKTSASRPVFRLIYLVIGAIVVFAIIGASTQVNFSYELGGFVFCGGYVDTVSQQISTYSSILFGLCVWIAEIACLYLFVKPLRQLIEDIKKTPDGQGFHLREFQHVAIQNTIASVLNITGILVCNITQIAISTSLNSLAADSVLANILFALYGLMSVGGMMFCMRNSFLLGKNSLASTTRSPINSNNVGRTSLGQDNSVRINAGDKNMTNIVVQAQASSDEPS